MSTRELWNPGVDPTYTSIFELIWVGETGESGEMGTKKAPHERGRYD